VAIITRGDKEAETAKNIEKREVDKLAKEWSDRIIYKLREKQGQALFFASEAYQDEGTILHVVKNNAGYCFHGFISLH
jgi:hypothetical protein